MSKVEYLNPPRLARSPAFSHGVVIPSASRTIHVGGQNGVDSSGAVVSNDLAEQVTQAIANTRVVLEAAGAGLVDIVSWTVAIQEEQDLRAAFLVLEPVLADRPDPPVVSVLRVGGLAVPGALVEISAIAVST